MVYCSPNEKAGITLAASAALVQIGGNQALSMNSVHAEICNNFHIQCAGQSRSWSSR